MGSFKDEMFNYKESTGAFSIYKHPNDDSCDNLLLQTSYYYLLLEHRNELTGDDREKFRKYLQSREICQGSFKRKSFETWPSSFDDHTAIAATSKYWATRIAEHGHWNDWTWNNNFLGRIPGFAPAIKAKAGISLSPLSQSAAIADYLGNLREPKEDVSGKILLWFRMQCYGDKYPAINAAIAIWKERMRALYPNGMCDVWHEYLKKDSPDHPFIKYSAQTW